MSKERELLERSLYFLEPSDWEEDSDTSRICIKLACEVEELLTQPEQTEQEPVAWKVIDGTHGGYMFSRIKPTEHTYKYNVVIPLYLAPPKREPIEDGELEVWYSQHTWAMDKQEYMWGFRDAEKAHGIGVDDE